MDKSGSFTENLKKFLAQAQTNDLKTKGYIKEFQGLEVKVSFGQGTQACIPWISFLGTYIQVYTKLKLQYILILLTLHFHTLPL